LIHNWAPFNNIRYYYTNVKKSQFIQKGKEATGVTSPSSISQRNGNDKNNEETGKETKHWDAWRLFVSLIFSEGFEPTFFYVLHTNSYFTGHKLREDLLI